MFCPYCGSEIDPDTCQCGMATADHNGYWDGHGPVPMGCTCHLKIEIVSANRPLEDTPENWQKIVGQYLDESRRADYEKMYFVECDACAAKPGSPTLCAGCLANRVTISRLRDKR